ncbi:CRP-like cAMP-binding protein [Saccharopolyspora phatthalungensis]|uniref:CRP-like cAMP-binding protein n=1 Tax=Saccharopolyspora phatthalungensis TaxID=664693 RepID=A0A840Q973_9PSEU|nr:CRP-like cAMP-binding protein [Saccharopolyspora phatthalungensis]
MIFAEGEPGDRRYIVQSGKVKLGRKTRDGGTNLLAVLGPSNMFGALSLLDSGPRASTATTVTEVRALSMDRAVLRRWISVRPENAEQLLCMEARRVRRTTEMVYDQAFTRASGRVAKALLQFAQRFGHREAGVIRVDHGLKQKEIAQYIGAARETVNTTLADLAHRGWLRLEADKTVVLLDPEPLARYAGTPRSPHAKKQHLARTTSPKLSDLSAGRRPRHTA